MPTSKNLPFSAAEQKFLTELERLRTPFLVVGVSAAVLQGADTVTQDLDLWFRSMGEPGIAIAARAAGGTFATRTNPPAVIGEGLDRIDLVILCHGLRPFDEEYADAVNVRVGDVTLKVLPLDRIIASKQAANRPKDRMVLDALRAALAVQKESRRGLRRKKTSR